jgi:hypothetical protein
MNDFFESQIKLLSYCKQRKRSADSMLPPHRRLHARQDLYTRQPSAPLSPLPPASGTEGGAGRGRGEGCRCAALRAAGADPRGITPLRIDTAPRGSTARRYRLRSLTRYEEPPQIPQQTQKIQRTRCAPKESADNQNRRHVRHDIRTQTERSSARGGYVSCSMMCPPVMGR